MAIDFVPERGRILICNYDMARVHPEMEKVRRAVVVSPRAHNARHGAGPGRCVVVPFSSKDPDRFLTPADVYFTDGVYRSLTKPTWAICGAVMSVSHTRLDRVLARGRYIAEHLSEADLARIEDGLRRATGM